MSHFDELLLLQKLDEISSQARTNPQNTKPQKTMSRTDEELLNDYIKSNNGKGQEDQVKDKLYKESIEMWKELASSLKDVNLGVRPV